MHDTACLPSGVGVGGIYRRLQARPIRRARSIYIIFQQRILVFI